MHEYTEKVIRRLVKEAKGNIRQACRGFGKPTFHPWILKINPAGKSYSVLAVPWTDPETGAVHEYRIAI